MNIINNPLKELKWFEESKLLLKKNNSIRLTGASGIEKVHIINSLAADFGAAIVVAENDLKARALYEDYRFFNKEVMYYPAKDLIFYQADINGKQIIIDRMKVLRKVLSGEQCVVITTFDAFMAPAVPANDILNNRIGIQMRILHFRAKAKHQQRVLPKEGIPTNALFRNNIRTL